jgi:hypothetical protein
VKYFCQISRSIGRRRDFALDDRAVGGIWSIQGRPEKKRVVANCGRINEENKELVKTEEFDHQYLTED